MATLEPFSGGMLNLRRFAARSVTDANLNLEENNKFSLNLHEKPYFLCYWQAFEVKSSIFDKKRRQSFVNK